MAHFRESYSKLEEEYYAEKQAYYERVREYIEGHKRTDRWRRILWGIIGLTLTAVLIWMICRPDISREAGQRTTDFLKNQYEEKSTMNYIFNLPASIHDMPFLLRLIPGFLYPVLRFCSPRSFTFCLRPWDRSCAC